MPGVCWGDSNGIANWKGLSRSNEAEYHNDKEYYHINR